MDNIYDITIDCTAFLDLLTDRAKLGHGKNGIGHEKRGKKTSGDRRSSSKLIDEMRKSFDIWIDNTGALANEPSKSLDMRLHAHGDIKKMVVNLLKMLVRNLKYLYEGESAKPSSSSSNDSDDDDLEDEAMDAIQEAVDELHFMAAVIRRSFERGEEYNLSSHFHRDGDSYFQENVCLLVRYYFKDARRSLCDHLGASLAIRRGRLLWRMKHEEKLITICNPEEFKQSIKPTQGPVERPQQHSRHENLPKQKPAVFPDRSEDTRPYVCLSEDCIYPMLFFVHMKDWMSHMVTLHSDKWHRKIHMGTWYCNVGHEAKLQFNDHESFVRHLKDPANHKDRDPPTDLQLNTLSWRNKRFLVRDEEYCCPLCECVPKTLESVIASSDPDKIHQSLYEHIAVHLKDLALKSIPTLHGVEPSGDKQSEVDDGSDRRLRDEDSTASYPSGLDTLRQETSLAFEDGSDRGGSATEDEDLAHMWNQSIVPEEPKEGEGWKEWEEWKDKATQDPVRPDPILDHFARTQRQFDQ